MAVFPVKYIHSDMRGAPVLSGTPGAMIGVLDAFLITGFGTVTAQRVSVAGGVATATLQSGQSFEAGSVVLIAGATPDALNGEARVLTATPSQITFATTAADGPASGTITIKVAPVGSWEKVFAGTNKAVYRSTDPQGGRFYYRIDDTGTTTCRLRGFESMTDVDNGLMPFPTDVQVNGGLYLAKSQSAGSARRYYNLFADSRFVAIAASGVNTPASGRYSTPLRGFGDLVALSPAGDVWSACVSGSMLASIASGANHDYGSFSGPRANDGAFVARSFAGAGGSQGCNFATYAGSSQDSGIDTTLGRAPSAVDGQIKLSRRYVRVDAQDYTPRADIPGLLHVPQAGAGALFEARDTMTGYGPLAGRTLVAMRAGPTLDGAGVYFVDVTGPWR